jgi:hypothetical protein
MVAAVKDWVRAIRKHRRFIQGIPRNKVLVLRYEEVLANPEKSLIRVCEMAGLEYEPVMLHFWERPQHYIGGNRGTLLSLMRKRQEDPSAVLVSSREYSGFDWRSDLDFYGDVDMEQRFRDDRWMHELTRAQKLVFRILAGRINRELGY